MSERPLSHVPRAVIALLALGLALQIGLKAASGPAQAHAADLPPAPDSVTLKLASLGDPVPLAKLLMLYLQAFDYQASNPIPYQNLDYNRLEAWLSRILELDPAGQYPLLAASRLYAEVPSERKRRQMFDFVYRQFFVDPNRRWPWLAHAATVAKHGLKDLPLARRYAQAIQQHAMGPDVPLWARQMEIFILEDMDELETARVMIGAFIQSGLVKDPGELKFLEQRLQQIEARLKSEANDGRGGLSKARPK